MKYNVYLTRSESRDEQLFAESPEAALEAAIKHNPGFVAQVVVQLGEGDDPVKEFEPFDSCENCNKIIWMDDPHVMTEDDCALCQKCCDELTAAQSEGRKP